MRAPDYISPIVGYRVWRWSATGLRSLNGVPWIPGQALTARCSLRKAWVPGRTIHAAHDAPQPDCRCGVYASKSLGHLRRTGYWEYGVVHGEVCLWGTVVEHEHGWRAQFACPKTLCLPTDILPLALAEIQSWLQSLIAYRCDIFLVHGGESVPLWRKESGIDGTGLDLLMGRGKEWYARHKQERTIRRGDRVAILGRGIAVVERVDNKQVQVMLWNRIMLRMRRDDIVWDRQNVRWETNPSSVSQTEPTAMSSDCTRI